MVLMSFLVSSGNLYLYCFYGNRSTRDYAEMAHYLYASNWYKHPVELQKFFKMMIANAQIHLFYDGSGIVQLNLETYLKVKQYLNMRMGSISKDLKIIVYIIFQLLKSVISYYLMFKTLVEE